MKETDDGGDKLEVEVLIEFDRTVVGRCYGGLSGARSLPLLYSVAAVGFAARA